MADDFVDFDDPAGSTVYPTELEYDSRFSLGGLRGSWGGVITCDLRLADPCGAGSTAACTTFAGGASGLLNACVTADGLVQAYERLTPGADGVQPMEIRDFAEWDMLRYGYCASLTAEGSTGGWAPVAYRQTSSSCATRPTYAL